MTVVSIDHVAIPIHNVKSMLEFYQSLGFEVDRSNAPNVYAVKLQTQKLNFHDPRLWQNPKFTLRAPTSKPGCGDFCFVWGGNASELDQKLTENQITIELGPAERDGGNGLGISTYVRDPDGNLVEFIIYPND